MNILKSLISALFFLGLFFFSFNDFEGISFLGEFNKEPAAIFFFFAFIVLLFQTYYSKKIILPLKDNIFKLIVLFTIWCFVCTLINLPTVVISYFKHTNGVTRFLRQYISLIISTFVFLVLYVNVLHQLSLKEIFFKIRRVFLWSLFIATIYGFLEICISYFGLNFLFPILKLFDYFPFLEVDLEGNGQISSICYEPPFLAIYLISIAGWMFSYILTEKSILKFIPTLIVLILTFFSGSRTGLLVVFIQFFIFILILYKDLRFRKFVIFSTFCFSLIIMFFLLINGNTIVKEVSKKVDSLNFTENLTKSISNKSRFGMQYASLQVFKDNPIIGVGFGQQTFHSKFHYPIWATKDNYEFIIFYNNSSEPSFPPGYNIYTRLLAEVGIVGVSIFISILYLSLKRTVRFIKRSNGELRALGFALLISFIGLFINWAQIDSFRIICIWIFIAILLKIKQEENRINESDSTFNTAF